MCSIPLKYSLFESAAVLSVVSSNKKIYSKDRNIYDFIRVFPLNLKKCPVRNQNPKKEKSQPRLHVEDYDWLL